VLPLLDSLVVHAEAAAAFAVAAPAGV
jgi:hypothetical protein